MLFWAGVCDAALHPGVILFAVTLAALYVVLLENWRVSVAGLIGAAGGLLGAAVFWEQAHSPWVSDWVTLGVAMGSGGVTAGGLIGGWLGMAWIRRQR